MVVFWSLVACMLLIALLVIVRHLVVTRQIGQVSAESSILAIFKQRLRELEQEQNAGLISTEQLQTVKLDMEKTLLDEVNVPAGESVTQSLRIPPDWKTAGLVLILIPVLAIGLYFQLGQPGIIDALRLSSVHGAADGQEQLATIEAMVDKLAARLQNSPDDVEGWMMLARSYKALGRFADAVTAYEHLYALTGDEPGVLLQYADAIAMANGNQMSGKPAELVQKALALSPDNTMGLWLAGMAASEQGDNNAALEYWQRLLPQIQDDAESYQEVTRLIQGAQKDLGMTVSDAGMPVATAAPAAATAPTVATGDKGIRVKVALAAELADQASPEDALFVFARATNGPPMPLAAARKQVKDLPLDIVLNDAMAMMPTLKISSYDSVQINARVSKSGTPTESSGDLVAVAVPARPGQEQTVELVIKSVVP
ncbi:MAG: c-type cytochrome biogenesis protein CcmI [Gammaproteobacteria bacterium RIFCSPLOWO2_02_FULL_52_10]|nr:MAG: c-type cytochrome biogenesis protein CcmI [Gammaproteobacteria bacterium RIFCSPLOWO2_02_FULL_52_10]